MKLNFKFICLSFIGGFLSSCEGFNIMHGVVVNRDTKQPLDRVSCVMINGSQHKHSYTDKLGKFAVESDLGFPNAEMIVRFSKERYDTLVARKNSDTIFYLSPRSK